MPSATSVSWNSSMRQILCCMDRFFFCSKDDMAKVMSEIFRERLSQDIPKSTINTQLHWMRRQVHGVWWHVFCEDEFNTNGPWIHHIQAISSAAQRLGITLVEKQHDDYEYPQDDSRVGEPKFSKEFLGSLDCLREITDTGSFDQASPPLSSISATKTATPSAMLSAMSFITPSTTSSTTPSVVPLKAFHRPMREESESLVVCHDKICFWCSKEGISSKYEFGDDPIITDPGISHEDQTHISDQTDEARQHFVQANDEMTTHEADTHEFDTHEHISTHMHDALDGCLPSDLPRVLFRWSNMDSQGINSEEEFRAGKFIEKEPYSLSSVPRERLLKYFRYHVSKKREESPFISTFRNTLAPIHRALRKGNDAQIALIDTSKLNTKVFNAHLIASQARFVSKYWKGWGEYLIWGQVPPEAISCTFKLKRLEEISESFDDLHDFLQLEKIRASKFCSDELYDELAKGQTSTNIQITIDRLMALLGVPHEIREYVSPLFESSWAKSSRFRGDVASHGMKTRDYTVFVPEQDGPFEVDYGAHPLWNQSVRRQLVWSQLQTVESSFCPSTTASHSSKTTEYLLAKDSDAASTEASKRGTTPSDGGGFSLCDNSSDDASEILRRERLNRLSPSLGALMHKCRKMNMNAPRDQSEQQSEASIANPSFSIDGCARPSLKRRRTN